MRERIKALINEALLKEEQKDIPYFLEIISLYIQNNSNKEITDEDLIFYIKSLYHELKGQVISIDDCIRMSKLCNTKENIWIKKLLIYYKYLYNYLIKVINESLKKVINTEYENNLDKALEKLDTYSKFVNLNGILSESVHNNLNKLMPNIIRDISMNIHIKEKGLQIFNNALETIKKIKELEQTNQVSQKNPH